MSFDDVLTTGCHCLHESMKKRARFAQKLLKATMVFALKVVAPATLEEGYSFDATIDGRTFRVKVPEGGVQAGEEFVVHDSQEIVSATKEISNQGAAAPQGHWRKGHLFLFRYRLYRYVLDGIPLPRDSDRPAADTL